MARVARWRPPIFNMNNQEDRLLANEQQTLERYFDLLGRSAPHSPTLDLMKNSANDLLAEITAAREAWEEAKRASEAHRELIRSNFKACLSATTAR